MYLDLAGFKNRALIPPQDVDRIARVRWDRGVTDASAAAATPETKFGDVVATGKVLTILAVFAAAIAHDAANYATLSVSKRTAGGAPVMLGTLATNATDIPAGVPVALAIAVQDITAEDVVTGAIAKAGAGVVIPAFTLDMRPSPNFVEAAIARHQAYIEGRLRKRYPIPLDAKGTVPECVVRWLTSLVTRDCYGRRGFNPSSEQDAAMVLDMATTAEAEIEEAADSETGLFDLPSFEGLPDTSGVTQGFPLSYSETSPYVAFDRQACDGKREDSSGRGSS